MYIAIIWLKQSVISYLQSAYARPGSAYVIQSPRKSHLDSTAMAACLSGDVLASHKET